jgi:hypothetical protein
MIPRIGETSQVEPVSLHFTGTSSRVKGAGCFDPTTGDAGVRGFNAEAVS